MFSITKANTDHCPLIHQMAQIAFRDTYQEILSAPQMEYMMEWMYSIDHLTQQMMIENHVYFIAYFNEQPCGYMSVQQQDGDMFHLQKIYVLPMFKGKGIGKALLQKAISYVKEVHPAPCMLELNVNRNNSAVSFYEHMGLKRLREGDFDIGNGYFMNDYIMGIELD